MAASRSSASRLLPALMIALAVSACDTTPVDQGELDPNGEAAVLRVLLTDAPADYIAAAEVDIGRVELIPADDGDPIVLSEDGTDGFVNLLDFQNAATMPLAEAEIEAGDYAQLRLIVDAARVGLVEGYTFRDGSSEKDLFVPSGAQTGIKLNLQGDEDMPLTLVPGEAVLVLDFDVNRSFVIQGNFETPAGAHGVIFKPTLRVTGQDVAASIAGVVSTGVEGVSVEGLVVTAEPTDAGSVPGYQTMSGTAVTDENGAYTIHFLVPGVYDVSVAMDEGLVTEPVMHSVELGLAEDATGADFEIVEAADDVTGSIAGSVTTALEDYSVAGLEVTATPAEGDPVTVETDDEGAYLFESLVAGTYTVTVDAGEDFTTDPASQEVELAEDAEEVDVDFAVIAAS